MNLLTNAIKYSPLADRIEVRSEAGLHVLVKDFGIGKAPQRQKAIFNRFYRVGGSTHITEGLGMGLHIARQIIEQHEGKIWLESEEGEGSVFNFTRPLTRR